MPPRRFFVAGILPRRFAAYATPKRLLNQLTKESQKEPLEDDVLLVSLLVGALVDDVALAVLPASPIAKVVSQPYSLSNPLRSIRLWLSSPAFEMS